MNKIIYSIILVFRKDIKQINYDIIAIWETHCIMLVIPDI